MKLHMLRCIAAVLGIVALSCGDQQEAPAEKKLKIAGIVFQEDQFFRLIQFGMQDAADKAGVELLLANSANKPDKEIQLVNTYIAYIARGVDAIVISPLSAKASATALQRAKDAGIVVVTYNSTVEGDIPAAYIESDQGDLGRQTGLVARRYIEEQLGGRAKNCDPRLQVSARRAKRRAPQRVRRGGGAVAGRGIRRRAGRLAAGNGAQEGRGHSHGPSRD